MFLALHPFIEALLAFICITVMSSSLSAWAYRYVTSFIDKYSGEYKSSWLFIYVLIAIIVGLWSTVLLVFPNLSELIIPAHCHAGVCSTHAPSIALNSVISGVLAIVSTIVMLAFLGVFYLSWLRYQQQLNTLEKLSDITENKDYNLIDSPALLAWSSGLWRTKIFISRGLTTALTPEELNIIVAHEKCHGLHHDNLRKLMLHWLSKLWCLNKNKLRDDFDLACEHNCDLYAVKHLASSSQVIQTIKKYAALAEQGKQKSDHAAINKRIELLSNLGVEPVSTTKKSYSVGLLVTILFGLLLSQIVFFTLTYHLWLDHLF
jgi:beta-lactamase regulating signal transducer with metallopeptidase domain